MVLGAGLTGMAAAFHLGEHCLLLDGREKLEDLDDHSHFVPMGTPRRSAVGHEDAGSEDHRPGVSATERKALFISCSSSGEANPGAPGLIHVARWQPPEFMPEPAREPDDHSFSPSIRILAPLLRGEMRFGAKVVRVAPSRHQLELADGSRIVYDVLLSTVPLSLLAGMAMDELPGSVRSNDALRCWLSEHGIDVADQASRMVYGDVDEFASGKRIADRMNAALAQKFGGRGASKARVSSVFEPRLVRASAAPSMP